MGQTETLGLESLKNDMVWLNILFLGLTSSILGLTKLFLLACLYLGRTSARAFQSTADLSSSAGPLPSLDVEGTWVS